MAFTIAHSVDYGARSRYLTSNQSLRCMLMFHLLDAKHKTVDYKIMMLGHNKGYKLPSAPIEDLDRSAHLCSLIRVFDGRSVGSQWFSVCSHARIQKVLSEGVQL